MSSKGGNERITISEFELESIPDSCTWIIIGPPGSGKCLAPGTEVITYNGEMRRVEDVRAGDLLMGDDNTPRTVLGTTTGMDVMYRITQSYGDTYTVNAPHILCLARDYHPTLEDNGNGYTVTWMEDNDDKSVVGKPSGQPMKCNLPYSSKSLAERLLQTYAPYRSNLLITAEDYFNRVVECDPILQEYKGYKVCITFPEPVGSVDDRLIALGKVYTELKGTVDEDSYKIDIPDYSIAKRVKFISDSLGFHTTIVHNICLSVPEETIQRNIAEGTTEHTEGTTAMGYYTLNIRGRIDRIPIAMSSSDTPPESKDLLSDITVERLEEGTYYGFELDGNHRFLLGDATVSHNTVFIEAMMYHLKHRYPVAKAFIGTEGAYERFCSILPPLFVHNSYDENELERHVLRQKHCAIENGQKHRANYSILVLDDISDDSKIFKTKIFKGLYKLGSQHWHQLTLFGTQYAIDVPPDIRKSVSFVSVFAEPEEKERKKIYENFGGLAGSFKDFSELMDQLTGDYTCLIFKKRTQSNIRSDNVFYFRAKLPPASWKLGCEEYKRWGHERMDPKWVDEPTV